MDIYFVDLVMWHSCMWIYILLTIELLVHPRLEIHEH